MASSIADRHLQLAREIVLSHLDGYNAKVFLFGSRSRGNARAGSDIDIAIDGIRKTIPNHIFTKIRAALDDSNLIYFVDIVNLHEADENLKKNVSREGVRWN